MRGTPCQLPNRWHSSSLNVTDGSGPMGLRPTNHECEAEPWSLSVSADY
jgi:hypothetical protein